MGWHRQHWISWERNRANHWLWKFFGPRWFWSVSWTAIVVIVVVLVNHRVIYIALEGNCLDHSDGQQLVGRPAGRPFIGICNKWCNWDNTKRFCRQWHNESLKFSITLLPESSGVLFLTPKGNISYLFVCALPSSCTGLTIIEIVLSASLAKFASSQGLRKFVRTYINQLAMLGYRFSSSSILLPISYRGLV